MMTSSLGIVLWQSVILAMFAPPADNASTIDPLSLGSSVLPPMELRGKPFVPKEWNLRGLANWERLDFREGDVTGIRMFGFDRYNGGTPLDFTSDDPVVCRTLEGVLNPSMAMRRAVLDGSLGRGSTGGGAYLGVLEIRTKGESLIVGVSLVGFKLGGYGGSGHTQFYSWGLTKQVDDLLFEETGKHLLKSHFAALSGEAVIKDNQAFYERVRKIAQEARN